MGENSAVDLCDVPSVVSFPGLGIGILLAIFDVCGTVFVLSEMLNIVVIHVSAVFPQVLELFNVYVVWSC